MDALLGGARLKVVLTAYFLEAVIQGQSKRALILIGALAAATFRMRQSYRIHERGPR